MGIFNEVLNKISPDNEEIKTIKEGEEIIKTIMGTKTELNTSFFVKMQYMGISPLNLWPIWHKVNKEVKIEVFKGIIQPQDIQYRIEQLLLENRTSEEIKQEEELKQTLLNNNITDYDFRCKLFAEDAYGKMEENINIYGYCVIKEDKLIIKRIASKEKALLDDKRIDYSEITSIDFRKLEKLSYMTSTVLNINGSEQISLLFTTEENYEQLKESWQKFNNTSK